MFLHSGFDPTRDCDTSDRYEVVSTGMSDAWERIHLGVYSNGTPAVSVGISGDPGSIHEVMRRHLETLFAHESGEDVVCMAVSAIDGDLLRSCAGACTNEA